MNFANESAGDEGLELVPKDPYVAARMRLQMVAFDKTMGSFFKVYLSRGKEGKEDLHQSVASWNDFAAPMKEGKWLLGTGEPTMLDLHVAPMFEMLHTNKDRNF